MDVKSFFNKNWQHFAILGLFLLIVIIYFSPQFNGQSVDQGDVTQYIGASNESYWFKDVTGQEQLWSNSMFGGMPTVQTTLVYPGNYIGRAMINFINWFPAPGGMVLLHLIGFYIMLLCFKVNRWVAVIGALAFAFASYEIVILGAGHNSKSLAVAFLPPVIGGFYLAYRHKFWLGIGLSSLFMTLEMSCNHLQVTYYLGILLVGLGIGEFVRAIFNKQLKKFIFVSGGLVVAYILALSVNYGNISMTTNYAENTIRGGNDLLLTPSGEINAKGTKGGLDKEYITTWSYGIGESFTLLSPYVKGGESKIFAQSGHEEILDELGLSSKDKNQLANYPVYWGEQPFTSGPVYVGVIMILLAFLGMFFLKDSIKWPLFIVGIIALMLSWGKNYMGFTEFWLDNVPGYNKFRTVTIILVLIELIVPLIAILFLDLLIKNRKEIQEQKRKFLYVGGSFIVLLIAVKMIGLGDNYTSKEFDLKQLDKIESQIRGQVVNEDPEQLLAQIGLDVNDNLQLDSFINKQMEPYENNLSNAKKAREEIYFSSMNRSLLFSVLALGSLALLFFSTVNVIVPIGLLGLFVMIDMMGVSVKYLSKDEKFWVNAADKKFPFTPKSTDLQIMDTEMNANPELKSLIVNAGDKKKKELVDTDYTPTIKNRLINKERFAVLNQNTNYRVFDYSGGFSSTKASYFHKSLGGYHGAKLRSIQNMYEFHISNSNNAVFDMLNVKYLLQPTDKGLVLRENQTALGPVWFIQQLKEVETRDIEISSLGKEFKIKNRGDGQMLVNKKAQQDKNIRGFEDVKYIYKGDTIRVPISNGIRTGMKALFVMDANGVTNLVPEFTIAADTINSFVVMVEIEALSEFAPKNEAYITVDNKKGIQRDEFSGKGEIKMDEYSPMKISYTSNTDDNQFAVFSEMYYKENWRAFIDNEEVQVYNVDYCLRGLEIPKGKHKIEFIYTSSEYEKANIISYILCTIVLLFVGFSFWKEKKGSELNEDISE